MTNELKEQWACALESGKYKQGTGAMVSQQDEDTTLYCCLGVLFDLVATDEERKKYHDGKSIAILPPCISDRIEIDQLEQGVYVDMNDNHSRDFCYIAKYIRGEVNGRKV